MKKRYWVFIGLILGGIIWIAFCGYNWGWGPFYRLHNIQTAKLEGNDLMYSIENVDKVENSNLAGHKMIFLGSSVTYGAASQGVSFADYIGARNDCEIIKEAVSGTTLVDDSMDSYIARMKKLDKNADIDLFVCQLSTNDATQNKPLGKLSEDSNYDTHTVAGAIEYIISYAKTNWDCPVVFYTNPYYESENYRMMVELLEEVAEKWDIEIINMWSDDSFNNITEEQRNLYMADAIHPTKAGYLEWWTPYIEEKIDDILRNNYKEVKFKVKHAEIVTIES